MDPTTTNRLVQELRESPVMAKLEAMAHELTGVVLLVFIRNGDQIDEIYATGSPAVLPEFCRIVRGSAEGRKRCTACRQLIALGACYRGLSEFCCHGGVSLIAAPGESGAFAPCESPIVASCAFALADHKKGWKAARAHARTLPLDIGQLKRAYGELPTLTGGNVHLVRAIVDAAAAAVNEIQHRIARSGTAGQASRGRTERELEVSLVEALRVSRDPGAGGRRTTTENTLIELVAAMISRDPALPFSVASIARAALITPNHLSMLFKKHTGMTFVSFLNGKRIDAAKKHLRELRLTVAEVADRSGFHDASYFGKRFRKATGHTPEDWRQRGNGM